MKITKVEIIDENNDHQYGTNPCSEIVLRPKCFCNLSEVVVRPEDNLETLKEKVRVATILGTLQATLTDFRYLSRQWKKNTEEEALLGVSMTGIMDNKLTSGKQGVHKLEELLEELKEHAIEVNKEWADKLNINPASAITCVKPSGTVSQLVDSASGIHTRFSEYYIRTVRADNKDPITRLMKDQGFPNEPCVHKPETTTIFSFPVASPKGSTFTKDMDALEQLALWKTYQMHWCEHKPSITVYVKEDEWLDVAAWCYKNFDILSGVSFLPHSDHVYKQAPYQEITRKEYKELLKEMPRDVDWSLLKNYEEDDNTTGTQELNCSAGSCEII